jgi:hypothetical protein
MEKTVAPVLVPVRLSSAPARSGATLRLGLGAAGFGLVLGLGLALGSFSGAKLAQASTHPTSEQDCGYRGENESEQHAESRHATEVDRVATEESRERYSPYFLRTR